MRWREFVRAAAGLGALFVACTPASGQLLPPLPLPPPVADTIGQVTDMTAEAQRTLRDARGLAAAQAARARALARHYPDRVALDQDGNAARAGELIVIASDAALEEQAARRGFSVIERVTLPELEIAYTRYATPRGVTLKRALKLLRHLAGEREVMADVLHFASGSVGGAATGGADGAAAAAAAGNRLIGIIDGGVPAETPGLAQQKAFARGGVRPHAHAAAIASLLTGRAGIRASAPGARLLVGDVYGSDPAGGNAAAIGQALAWMARENVPVVVVSLVGPPNPLLARIVAAARRLGTLVVAAVGNDGPAAPPAYPASYPGAIAVTGVDLRNRLLIEAGRASKTDYAAPGANLLAAGLDGKPRAVRGTSFAAPFVAARLSARMGAGPDAAIAALDREAQDLGKRGPDPQFGRGLICGDCATRPR